MGTARALQGSWLDPSTLTGCAGRRTRRPEGQASKPRPRCKDPASNPRRCSSISCLTCPAEHSAVTVNRHPRTHCIPGAKLRVGTPRVGMPRVGMPGWGRPGWADGPLPAQGGLTWGPRGCTTSSPGHRWDKRPLFSNTLPGQRPQTRFLLRKPQAS